MTVLVAAATRHGATREIAQAIGDTLTARGIDTEVADIEHVGDVASYDAVVLGSAVYMGKWLEPARQFVYENRRALGARPTWLFSSGPTGPALRGRTSRTVQIGDIVMRAHPRDHHVFSGRLAASDMTLPQRILARLVRAQIGDYRDWDDIRGWAGSIADRLNGAGRNE